jgi:hypothetical protein
MTGIVHRQQGQVRRGNVPADQGADGTPRPGLFEKRLAIEARAAQGHEQALRFQAAGVGSEARIPGVGTLQTGLQQFGGFGQAHANHAAPPARAARTWARSLKGRRSAPICW